MMLVEGCARDLWGRRPRALSRRRWGNPSFHPASAGECLTPVEHEEDEAERQQNRAGDHLQLGVRCGLWQRNRVQRCRDRGQRTLRGDGQKLYVVWTGAAFLWRRQWLRLIAEYLFEVPTRRQIDRKLRKLQ